MRRAQHYIDNVGKLGYHYWERIEHMFDPLVWGKQPERQQYLLAPHAKLFLVSVRSGEWHIGNAMRD
jgi:hypothetical protein